MTTSFWATAKNESIQTHLLLFLQFAECSRFCQLTRRVVETGMSISMTTSLDPPFVCTARRKVFVRQQLSETSFTLKRDRMFIK